MMKQDTTKGPLGTVRIADYAIASISAIAAREVEGVIELQGNILDFLAEIVGKRPDNKGIRVDLLGKEVIIEISVCIRYGVDIADVSSKIQEKVREAVENMTGLTVSSVNVNINTIRHK